MGNALEHADFEIDGLQVQVVRKPIRHIYLRLRKGGPDYYVQVSAPIKSSDKHLHEVVAAKLPWLLKQRERQEKLSPPVEQIFADGEEHFYLGHAYRLKIVHGKGVGLVVLSDFLELHVPPKASLQYRKNLISRWYRNQLASIAGSMSLYWQEQMGVSAKEWRVRKMKSRWGSCNIAAQRIWLNLELVKKPLICIEYVLVHELAHLRERGHGANFWALVGKYLPNWKELRKILNTPPI